MKEGAAAPLQPNKDFEFCEAITRIRCLGAKQIFVAHDGGPTPLDGSAHTFSLMALDGSVCRNRFFEHPIVDFCFLASSPWANADVLGLAVLEDNQLHILDSHTSNL